MLYSCEFMSSNSTLWLAKPSISHRLDIWYDKTEPCFTLSLNFVICKNERKAVILLGEVFSHYLFFMGKNSQFFLKYLFFVVIVLMETKIWHAFFIRNIQIITMISLSLITWQILRTVCGSKKYIHTHSCEDIKSYEGENESQTF